MDLRVFCPYEEQEKWLDKAADAEAFERIRGIVKAAVPELKESLLNLAKG